MTYAIVERNLLERAIVFVCSCVMWITTGVIFLILTANTFMRYVGAGGLQWANEIPELLFPWLVMAGVVLAAEKGAHITTVFLVESISENARRRVAMLIWLLVAVMYAVLVYATWGMLEIVHDERTPILLLPGSITYVCVMTGMAMLCLLAFQSAWREWRRQRVVDSHSDLNGQIAQG